MQLSPHFTLDELTRSVTALRHGLDNTPAPVVVENLRRICQVLEIIRGHFNRRIRVSSGYRSPEVNRACGGSPTSAHRFGLAVDFTIDDVPPAVVCQWVADNITGFDQCIYEFGASGWCHLGLAAGDAHVRQQLLTAGKSMGKTIYVPGIVEIV